MANTPNIGPYTELKPFRFWCQKVLPLVYDESLSYYELLCKVVDYLNKTMEDVDQMIIDMGGFQTAYGEFTQTMEDKYTAFTEGINDAVETLENFVNNYFENLDVQDEIDNKIDEMAEQGYFDELFGRVFSDELIAVTRTTLSQWLYDNIVQETGYVIDKSLTVENAAADAKATGNAIADLRFDLNTVADGVFTKGEALSIQRMSNAASFTKNNPKGFIYVESTDKPIFTGTVNFIDLFGLAQGTFVDNEEGGSGVTIEINGNEVYIHGSPSRGFRFDLQTGEFYTDSLPNHPGDLSILPDIGQGYSVCFWEKSGYTMPSNVYFGKLNQAGDALAADGLNGHAGYVYQSTTYLALYSNVAIDNLDVKFTFGLKQKEAPYTVASIEECAKAPYGTTIIQRTGYYKCGEFTWTGDATICTVWQIKEKYPSITEGHVYAWFGDSISQLKELPNLVSELLPAPVYDCTFAGAPLTYGNPTLYQPTGFMSLCSQIVAGDFSDLSAAIDAQEAQGINVSEKRAHLATLQALDFNNVTDIIVFAGTNDFDNDYVNATNFVNGFSSALTALLTEYPHLIVYVFSPIWRGDKDTGKPTIPTMEDLVDLEKSVADEFSLPWYDLYHRSGINEYTATVYLQNDILHPSDAGDRLLANKCTKFIRSN